MYSCFFVEVNCNGIQNHIYYQRARNYDSEFTESGLSVGQETLAYTGNYDFGHTTTEWESVIKHGITGLRRRISEYAEKNKDDKKKQRFYSEISKVYDAALRFMKRASEVATENGKTEMSAGISNLTEKAPSNLFEAMQTTIIYYVLQHMFDGTNLRTLGRLDSLFYPFFKGCPLKCIWCHNPESISFEKQVAFYRDKCIQCGICKGEHNDITAQSCPVDALMPYGTEYEVSDLVDILMQDEVFFRNSGGGVTLSGGECLAQPDFAVAVAKKIKSKGISVYVDTCGFVKQESLESIIPFTDKFLYDIKAINSNVHKKCTGMDNELILKNLEFLSVRECAIEIRYPLVKGYNDEECDKIGEFLSNLKGISKVKVLQYHHFAASRYQALSMTNTLPDTETTYDDIENVTEILKSYGLNAVNEMIEN